MKKGEFIWADLSTYNTKDSILFYKSVFGWQISNDNEYYLAKIKDSPVAGIFETPDYLKKINMPHFWMSYFQVESVTKTVESAKKLNAIIEVDATEFNNGNIALIRDPQGAGFTVYDGTDLHMPSFKVDGTIIKTELHVSDLTEVIPFYSKLFGWNLKEIDDNILAENPNSNIQIHKIPNSLKGKYEYWVTTFLVNELEKTTNLILENGGHLLNQEQKRNLMSDNSNEAFFYIQTAI